MKAIAVKENSNLQLHIYVLGYYPLGESILVIIYEKGIKKVHRSILIDCYESNRMNRFSDIFRKYNIDNQKLDVIIWTHPDIDHSIGFKNIIDNYIGPNTYFILPESLTKQNIKSSSAIKTFDELKEFEKTHRYNIERVSASNRRSNMLYEELSFDDIYTDPIYFCIEILTPFSGFVFHKTEQCKGFIANDISISVIMHFGKLNFYFGGDSENKNINMINEDMLKGVDFIKIPHHASSSASSLLNKISTNFDNNRPITAISTSFLYGRTNLPTNGILDDYKPYCDRVLLTEDTNHQNNYGIWKVVYNIQSQELYLPEPIGDATSWYKAPNLQQ